MKLRCELGGPAFFLADICRSSLFLSGLQETATSIKISGSSLSQGGNRGIGPDRPPNAVIVERENDRLRLGHRRRRAAAAQPLVAADDVTPLHQLQAGVGV